MNNIKIDLQNASHENMNWINLALNIIQWTALVKAVIKCRIQKGEGNLLTSRVTIRASVFIY
jgi:hypothetical protein